MDCSKAALAYFWASRVLISGYPPEGRLYLRKAPGESLLPLLPVILILRLRQASLTTCFANLRTSVSICP